VITFCGKGDEWHIKIEKDSYKGKSNFALSLFYRSGLSQHLRTIQRFYTELQQL
jgi:hypothetical protein